MHETSLGQVIVDYLTGQEIKETTYEEFRQALAKMLVEEKGYPRELLQPRVEVSFPIEGRQYARIADLAAFDSDGKPLLVLMFCSGMINSYFREVVAAARLFPGGPAPLAVITDTKEAALMKSSDGEILLEGMSAIPDYDRLKELAAAHPSQPLEGERLNMERRILYTYSEYLTGCCGRECSLPEQGGG